MLRIAVVGSGPSGVYTTQSLLDQHAAWRAPIRVDVLERLPCPYGLVRYGVAPDHEKIKSLQTSLRKVLERPGVRFLGNVAVGEGGVAPGELLGLYHAVVYCVGAARERQLGIPGEDLMGSVAARDFVAWYSAHPDAAAGAFALRARSVVVIGVGNVAVDVARILARGAEELRATDMPQGPLDALLASTVREIHMVGRRGPSQAKFTTKELRELCALPGVAVTVRDDELAADPAYRDASGLSAVARRNVAALHGLAQASGQTTAGRTAARRVLLRFFLRPVEMLDDGQGAVRAVRFERTVPDGAGGVAGTGRHVDVAARLVLRSAGYRGTPMPGLPFNARSGTVPHAEGRVLRDGAASPGEYVAGWIKRGPTGVIGSNRPCAKETAGSLLADQESLARRAVSGADPLEALRAAGHEPVEWQSWLDIEAAEAALGLSLSRGTVKIPDWAGLLSAARGG